MGRDRCGTAQLFLPADVSVYQEALDHQGENGGPAGVMKITHVSSPIENLGRYLVYTPILDFSDLSRLNTLAERVDAMDQREQRVFAGILDAEEISGLDDILRISRNLNQYEVIEGVVSDHGLGKWLVESGRFGKEFPESVRPYSDYAAIAVKYRSDHGGIYTQTGYVKNREELPTQTENAGAMLLTLKTSERSYPLVLPASEERLEQAKRALGIDDFSQAAIDSVEYMAPYLDRLIPTDCITVEDANEMADYLQKINADGEMMKYRTALEAEEPSTFSEALDMAIDLDSYELISDNGQGYGTRQTGYGLVHRLSEPFLGPEIGQTMM